MLKSEDPEQPINVTVSMADVHRVAPVPIFTCVAVWMCDEADDMDEEYEFEINVQLPGAERQKQSSGKFKFTKTFHRFLSMVVVNEPAKQDGTILVENRIRRVGSHNSDWLSQDFPIPITITTVQSSKDKGVASEHDSK